MLRLGALVGIATLLSFVLWVGPLVFSHDLELQGALIQVSCCLGFVHTCLEVVC